MELIGILGHRRLERELQRREAALREAAQMPEQQEPAPLPTKEPEWRPLLAPEVPATRDRWECDFCGRGFFGYGPYLNHRCDSDTDRGA